MRFIDEHCDQFAVALLLRVLDIAESTYYAWVKQTTHPCDRELVDRGLLSNIHEVWIASEKTYGADRIHQQRSPNCSLRNDQDLEPRASDDRAAL